MAALVVPAKAPPLTDRTICPVVSPWAQGVMRMTKWLHCPAVYEKVVGMISVLLPLVPSVKQSTRP